jgi:hypothetical protein
LAVLSQLRPEAVKALFKKLYTLNYVPAVPPILSVM